MGRTNAGTPMDMDGWADVLTDIAKLQLDVSGGSNDLNQASKGVDQDVTEYGFPLIQNNLSEYLSSPAAITQIKNNLRLTQEMCSITRSGPLNFATTTDTVIFNVTTDDDNNAYNTTTGAFVAPVTGIYTFSIILNLKTINGIIQGTRNLTAAFNLYKNGSTVLANVNQSASTTIPAPNGNNINVVLTIATAARLTAGDAVTLIGYGLSWDGSNLGRLETTSVFSATWTSQ